MKYLLALLFAASAWGQITATPTTITTYVSEYGTSYNDPAGVNIPPMDTAITVSGTGAWNLARGGSLATLCGGSPCFTIGSSSSGYSGTCPSDMPSGSGATTLYLCWKNKLSEGAAGTIGTKTGTGTVGSTIITVNLIVVPRPAFVPWVWPSASYPVGCTFQDYSGFNYPTPDNCGTFTDERPVSTALTIPAVGGSFVDPQFGSTITRATPTGWGQVYSTVRGFNANDSLILAGTSAGFKNAYPWPNASTTPTYSSIPNLAFNLGVSWDHADPFRLWSMTGSTLIYRQLDTSTTVTAANYASSSGSRPALGNIQNGGTVDTTDDGWWVFHDYTNICAVNTNGLIAVGQPGANQESKTFCGLLSDGAGSNPNYLSISQVDSESHKRYLCAWNNTPPSGCWTVNTTTGVLDFYMNLPYAGISFQSISHSSFGQDEFGRQIYFVTVGTVTGVGTWLAAYQLNKGADMVLPVAIGGGGKALYNGLVVYQPDSDSHHACNFSNLCLTETRYAPSLFAQTIASITTGAICQINLTSHGYTNGASIQISGALGSGGTAINGVWSITTAGANAFTIPLDCTGATYTASSGYSSTFTAASAAPFRSEIILSRPGQWVRRLAAGRQIGYTGINGNPLSTYGTSYMVPNLSRTGRYVLFNSNMGLVEEPSTYVVDVGYPMTTKLSSSVAPADTEAVLSYSVPAGQAAATITISASPNLTSPVVSASDGLTGQGRQYVATGLTAATQYYYRVLTTTFSYTGQFRTAPTLSSTGRFQISVGGGGTFYYGTTTGVADGTCTSPCDIAPAKGILYTRVGLTGAVTATVVR